MFMLLQAHRAMQRVPTPADLRWKARGSMCTVLQVNLTGGPPAGAEAWPLQLQPPQGSEPCPPAAAWRQPADKLHDLQRLQGVPAMQPGTDAHRQGRLLYMSGLGSWVWGLSWPPIAQPDPAALCRITGAER